MGDIVPFDFHGNQVRVVLLDGEPWWVGRDVAAVLGYTRTADAIADHVPDRHKRRVGDSPTPIDLDPQTVLINEAGMWRLVMRSKLPSAEEFQEWVTAEVLPQIRKTGAYGVDKMTPAEFLVYQAQRIFAQEQAVKELGLEVADVAARVDGLEGRTGWYTAKAYAKLNGFQTNRSYLLRVGIRAGKLGRSAHLQKADVPDEREGTVNGWPEWVWRQAFEDVPR